MGIQGPLHPPGIFSLTPVLSGHSPISIPGHLAPSSTFPPIGDISVTCLSLMDSILGSPLINEPVHRGPQPPPSPGLPLPFFSQESGRLLVQGQVNGFGDRNTWISLGFAPLYTRACSIASVMSDFLQPQGLEPAKLLCPWGCSRQEYWSGLPCPPPRYLPDPGIKPASLMSPAMVGGFFTTSATWEALCPLFIKWDL